MATITSECGGVVYIVRTRLGRCGLAQETAELLFVFQSCFHISYQDLYVGWD